MTALAPPAKAQLLITVYPSQDNPNTQTLWIFRGNQSSTATYGSSIRSSQNFHRRDSWQSSRSNTGISSFFKANFPTNQLFTLSPLFQSASNPKDIESIQSRIPGGSRRTSSFYSGQTFQTSATNTPTITIGGASRPIGSISMNASNTVDEIGIRITPPNLVYSANDASSWFGAGILNKPISDFNGGSFSSQTSPYFTGWVRIDSHLSVIPEPKECALFFAIFAVAFVIIHRYLQGKRYSFLKGIFQKKGE